MFVGFTYQNKIIYPPEGLFYNVIPFKHSVKKLRLSIYENPDNGRIPVPVQLLNSTLKAHFSGRKYIYFDLKQPPNVKSIKLNLQKYPELASAYYTQKIREILVPKADYHLYQKPDETQFWCINANGSRDSVITCDKYHLKTGHDHFNGKPELTLSYDGCSYILKENISYLIREKETPKQLIRKVVWQNKIYSYNSIPEEAACNLHEIYAVLNPDLARHLQMEYPAFKCRGAYNRFYVHIFSFYTKYLLNRSFRRLIPHEGVWKSAGRNYSGRLNISERKLLFGKNTSSYDPFIGLKENGPLKLPEGRQFHYFFIYMQKDEEDARRLYHYIIKKEGFLEMAEFTCLRLQYSKDHDIRIPEGDDPEDFISQQLRQTNFDEQINWYAFYISPYSSLEEDLHHKALYYRIKEMLLYCHISMQAVVSSHLRSDFRHSVSGIGIAMIAKLGGTPWRLDLHANGTLVIGMGAFRLRDNGAKKYAGSLVCFEEDGRFMEFDVFSDTDTKAIAHAAAEAFCQYRSKRKHTSEIVIHFYKNMNERDLQPIEEMLSQLDMDIPVVVAIISKCRRGSMLLFDNPEKNAMPVDGSWAMIAPQTWLLNINARRRHSDHTVKQCFPLKIQLHCNKPQYLDQPGRAEKILSQIYSFSFMHWRSVKQSPLPVTIKYPSLIASFLPWFRSENLPEDVRTKPWFL